MMLARLGSFVAASMLASAAAAEPFQALVVHVVDGDTVDVAPPSGVVTRVRLAFLDAPERGQAFGQTCRLALATRLTRRHVTVRPVALRPDPYGRLVATIQLGEVDLGQQLIDDGCAWHAVHYAREGQGPIDFAAYQAAHQRAVELRRGLWAHTNPIDPAAFRRAMKP